jgi:intracellular sulfur oxidation DsrE/DsrF family protein
VGLRGLSVPVAGNLSRGASFPVIGCFVYVRRKIGYRHDDKGSAGEGPMPQFLKYCCARCAGLLAIMLALATPHVSAEMVDDKQALAGLSEVKVAFDITAGDGKGLLNRLNVIDETRQSLIKQGVKPNFVLAFRGPATKLVQTDIEKVKPEDRAELAKIAAKIKEMSTMPGVQAIEQCSVAIRQQGTAADKVLAEIKVVGNSWISLMAYQAKGYAYIAP